MATVLLLLEWGRARLEWNQCRGKLGLPPPPKGEGWGEGLKGLSMGLEPPHPNPLPSRSRVYPTSAKFKCRTRGEPEFGGEGAQRVRGPSSLRARLPYRP